MAKHHNLPGIASRGDRSGTRPYRGRGAGGIMLPNHAPRLIAEQFGTLAALHPGRVDLGLGHAPGSDQVTAQAMRRTLHSSGDDFPHDVVELIGYFQAAEPGQVVQAVPGAGLDIPIWILDSSTYGSGIAISMSSRAGDHPVVAAPKTLLGAQRPLILQIAMCQRMHAA